MRLSDFRPFWHRPSATLRPRTHRDNRKKWCWVPKLCVWCTHTHFVQMGKFSAETVWLPHWLYAGASAMAPTTHRSAYSCPCRAARLLYNARCVDTSSAWSSDRSLLLLLYSRSPWQQCRTVRIFSKQHLPSAIPPSTRGCFARPARYIHLIFLPSSGLPVRWLLPHNSNFVFFSLSLSIHSPLAASLASLSPLCRERSSAATPVIPVPTARFIVAVACHLLSISALSQALSATLAPHSTAHTL